MNSPCCAEQDNEGLEQRGRFTERSIDDREDQARRRGFACFERYGLRVLPSCPRGDVAFSPGRP